MSFDFLLRATAGMATAGGTEFLGLGDAIQGVGQELTGEASAKRRKARNAALRRQRAENQRKRNEAVMQSYRKRRQSQGAVGGINDGINLLTSLGSKSDTSTTTSSLLTKEA